ncbi:MAG: ABC transporter permease [Candidatus Terraquivivens tikiterensis]|uniref:ABC transporter permease n=1 Tax=Candidatus Terraquivivens tikiterensis TaxID=1980982 RepID=A0A2R7Y1D4_9ARCH|nr:MAG: ABC transporter permease [Candidatus Terraquivivens tikiterensis]
MRLSDFVWSMLPIGLFAGVWEIVARLNLIPGSFFLPPFSVVVQELFYLTVNGVLLSNLLHSLIRVLVGLTLGSISGICIGILMGYSRVMHAILNPIVSLLYPIPALGWLPLLMLWIGINEALPITIIFLCSFFPTAYATATGIRNVDRKLIRAAETLGASPATILRTIILPCALPTIFTGLRLESGMAWRVVIAAEMIAIPTGMGALFMQAQSLIRVDIIIACLMVLSLMCLFFEKSFQYMESRLCRWARHFEQS